MSDIAAQRKLLEQANLLVKTNDAATVFIACASLLDTLCTLMSEWTGEVVRVSMTAEGRPDALDMVKHPTTEALQTDAQRYRWLREQQWNTGLLAVVADPKAAIKLGHDCPSLERLDDAIDAAMAVHRLLGAA